jgi:hypothetical protein
MADFGGNPNGIQHQFQVGRFYSKGESMKKEVGLWIDHKKAIAVILTQDGDEIKRIESDVENRTRFSSRSGSKSLAAPLAENHRDQKIVEHFNKYYNEVIACLRDAETLLIFGPGEAKLELEKRLEHSELKKRIARVETVDKMTEPQIVAKVRKYFHGPPALPV